MKEWRMGRKAQLIIRFIFSTLITIPIWLTFSDTLLQLNCIFDSPLGKVFCMTILHNKHRQHIKKQRHYLANKGQYNQSCGFLAVMYRCENWTIKKAEHWRIDTFELRCWRRLLRVSWTARKSNQSILEENNWIFIGRTDAEAEVLTFWPPDAKNKLTGKKPGCGKDWIKKEKTAEDEMVR